MMNRKKRISIIAGNLASPQIMQQFDSLSGLYDVTVFVFDDEALPQWEGRSFAVKVYSLVKDMPGYMRGLEDSIKDYDLVVALGTSMLCSFQACRAAKKQGKHFFVYSSEWQLNKYENYPNIQAIQFDVIKNADLFLASTPDAVKYLCANGAVSKNTKLVPYRSDTKKYIPDASKRTKFKKYIGMADDQQVVLYRGDLNFSEEAEVVLRTVSLLKNSKSKGAEDLRVIIAGEGKCDKYLKYLAHDLGLGESALFIHQPIELFAEDLYNSVDYKIFPNQSEESPLNLYPFDLVDPLSCGVIPLTVDASKESSLLAGAGLSARNSRADEFAIVLSQLIGDEGYRNSVRTACLAQAHKIQSGPAIVEVISSYLGGVSDQRISNVDLAKDGMVEIDSLIGKGENDLALIDVEKFLLEVGSSEGVYSELLRAKGDILYANGDHEGAMEAYQSSLQINSDNSKSYCGLGFVAWKSHSNDEAITFFKSALAIKQNDFQTMLGLGLVHKRVGLIEHSIYWFEKCLSTDAEPDIAVAALAQACNECSRPTIAVAALNRAIDLVGERRVLLMGLGNLYMRTGKTVEGRNLVNRALDQVS